MKRIFGLAAIVAGGVLALFFPDLEFGWFRGRPLGIALVVIGGIEILESTRRRRPKGVVEELRDDFGPGARHRDRNEVRGGDRERDRDRETVREFDREVEREARKYRDYPDS
ncbi:hypothetical protein ACF064_24440 [Streptomyces sp. NPDC015492]|uniref:DUF308 domain-containing protein n=1 Tax=unclassified Streptomyces TaxID=2593676 RepID=UPI003407158F